MDNFYENLDYPIFGQLLRILGIKPNIRYKKKQEKTCHAFYAKFDAIYYFTGRPNLKRSLFFLTSLNYEVCEFYKKVKKLKKRHAIFGIQDKSKIKN